MKKHILVVFSLLVFISESSFAQNDAFVYINAQLRAYFSPLSKPNPSKQFLYEMSAKISDSIFYQTQCPDTIETDMWQSIYEEMYHAAYDTSWLPIPDTLFTHGNNFSTDTIPMGIMNFGFYTLIDSALTTNTYFDFDTINDILSDQSSRPGFPYLDSNMFVAAPIIAASEFANPVFRIDPEFILYDYYNALYYNSGDFKLKIDFDDGLGWITFDPTVVTHRKVTYATSGQKIIKTAIFNLLGPVTFTSSSFFNVNSPAILVHPDSYIETEGLVVGLYSGCSDNNSGKTIIYLSGFDPLDLIPSENRTVPIIYDEAIRNDKIVQLRNLGYNFLVVDYANSRIDIRFNALYFVNLLEKLKCESTDNEQFVIMGESMGGLVARFALTYMETSDYLIHDNSAFFVDANDENNIEYLAMHPHIFSLPHFICDFQYKMHNTRLLITLDTPHQGANVPMSAQYAYQTVTSILGKFLGFNLRIAANAISLALDGQAAQQMLIYHVSTEYGGIVNLPPYSYTCKMEKDIFFGQLWAMGNYPNFTKVVAMSNGSLTGQNQNNSSTLLPRVPGDQLIDLHVELFVRILRTRFNIFGADLTCLTNQTGHIFNANAGFTSIRIRLRRWGFRFDLGYNSLLNKSVEATGLLPFCTSAGGFSGNSRALVSGNHTSSYDHHDNPVWIFDFFHAAYTVTGGCMDYNLSHGIVGFSSSNVHLDQCSDGFHFGFVPVQSALDYDVLGVNFPLNLDLSNESITDNLARTPVSVIIAQLNGNEAHVGNENPITGISTPSYRNDEILNLTNINTTSSTNNLPNSYHSCARFWTGPNPPQRGFLNLEIGDEELYLENAKLPWNADYSAEFDIHVNDRNPHYGYPSGPGSLNILPGIYSKEDPYYILTSGQATFHVGVLSPSATPGLHYSPPYSGAYFTGSPSIVNCCRDYLGSRSANTIKQVTDKGQNYLRVYPNPNNGRELVLNYRLKGEGIVKLSISNLLGEKIYEEQLASNETNGNCSHINLSNLQILGGFYVLRIGKGNETISTKLVISK